MFRNQTYENVPVKDEYGEEFWTQEVITKDESTEVKLEGQHHTETQVLFGMNLNSINCYTIRIKVSA